MVKKAYSSCPKIKTLVKSIPRLSLIHPKANLIVETDVFNIGYGEILKQCLDKTESVVRFHTQEFGMKFKKITHSKKKKLLAIVLCSKFQGDLINKRFTIKTYSRASKFVIGKKCQKSCSKTNLC